MRACSGSQLIILLAFSQWHKSNQSVKKIWFLLLDSQKSAGYDSQIFIAHQWVHLSKRYALSNTNYKNLTQQFENMC